MQYLLVRGKWEPLPHVLELLPKQIKMKQHSSLDQYNQSYLEGPNLMTDSKTETPERNKRQTLQEMDSALWWNNTVNINSINF